MKHKSAKVQRGECRYVKDSANCGVVMRGVRNFKNKRNVGQETVLNTFNMKLITG